MTTDNISKRDKDMFERGLELFGNTSLFKINDIIAALLCGKKRYNENQIFDVRVSGVNLLIDKLISSEERLEEEMLRCLSAVHAYLAMLYAKGIIKVKKRKGEIIGVEISIKRE